MESFSVTSQRAGPLPIQSRHDPPTGTMGLFDPSRAEPGDVVELSQTARDASGREDSQNNSRNPRQRAGVLNSNRQASQPLSGQAGAMRFAPVDGDASQLLTTPGNGLRQVNVERGEGQKAEPLQSGVSVESNSQGVGGSGDIEGASSVSAASVNSGSAGVSQLSATSSPSGSAPVSVDVAVSSVQPVASSPTASTSSGNLGGDGALREASQNLERGLRAARADLSSAEGNRDSTIAQADSALSSAESGYDRNISEANRALQQAQRQADVTYGQAQQSFEQAVRSAETARLAALNAAQRSFSQAGRELDVAGGEDEGGGLQGPRLSQPSGGGGLFSREKENFESAKRAAQQAFDAEIREARRELQSW